MENAIVSLVWFIKWPWYVCMLPWFPDNALLSHHTANITVCPARFVIWPHGLFMWLWWCSLCSSVAARGRGTSSSTAPVSHSSLLVKNIWIQSRDLKGNRSVCPSAFTVCCCYLVLIKEVNLSNKNNWEVRRTSVRLELSSLLHHFLSPQSSLSTEVDFCAPS